MSGYKPVKTWEERVAESKAKLHETATLQREYGAATRFMSWISIVVVSITAIACAFTIFLLPISAILALYAVFTYNAYIAPTSRRRKAEAIAFAVKAAEEDKEA